MYLKRVEIVGFKSFADKTVLNFEKGITGIIGPNGCGKSNISDAIRWCLGEQRATAMRGKRMLDVIFGGTQKKPASGMAEVSLVFDNANSVLPIEYSEVLITRKLFKNGESEYFINKTQCRLKDIRDLFLDTGISFDGYSIIEQGKVDFLVTANPEGRRELFEEVAGVAKYKARREETLKRLEKVETDMARLTDALSIHKQQIDALDQQARKAKQYKKYQEELEKYETADLVSQIRFGDKEIQKTKENLEPKIKEFELSTTLAAQTDAEIAEMRLLLDEKNEQYVNLNSELNEIKTNISLADSSVANSSQREEEIRAEQERLSEEIAVNREKTTDSERELNTIGADDNTLSVEVENLEKSFKEKEQQYSEIKIKLSELTAKAAQIRAKLSETETLIEEKINLKTQISERRVHLDAENASLKRILVKLESDIEPTQNEIAAIEAELLQANQILLSNEEKTKNIAAQISENEIQIGDCESKLGELKNNLASNSSRIETLKEFDKSDPIRSAIRDVIKLGLARGPVSSLIDTNPQNEELVASALGEKLNYLICPDSQSAEKAIEFLEEKNLSRLSFIIEDKISSQTNSRLTLPNGASELIQLLKFNSVNEKIIRFICSDSITIGKKIYSGIVVCGGGKSSLEKPVLIEEQVKRLEDSNEQIRQNITSFEKQILEAKDKKNELTVEKNNLSFESIKINTQIENKRSQIEEKKFDITGYTDEINKNKSQIDLQSADLEKFNEQISSADIEIAELSDLENSLSAEVETIDNEIISMRSQEETLSPLMMEARSLFDKKKSDLENRQKGRQYIRQSLDTIKEQIEFAINRIAQNETKLAELLNTQQTETVKIQQLHEERAEKEALIQVSLSEREEFQTKIDLKTESLYELRNKTEQLNADINSMQVDLKNSEFQRNNLSQKLEEIHGKSYEEIEKDFGDAEINREEIAKIKRRMEALGSINHAAPEEYDALEQKYNFLLEQQTDLLKAKEDLREVIKKINDSTIENFKKTFDIVRANFQALYRKLFEGGEADLKLTDENNLLESGIDIFAQPPGKKLQNISLYSGGEKALTAVALLFAFFMVKASPFCILDEVDAPLDAANIGRYNQMIQDFIKDTQFLIVTHNPRTMEIADILYGVSAEEQGVSRIYSYKLDKKYAE